MGSNLCSLILTDEAEVGNESNCIRGDRYVWLLMQVMIFSITTKLYIQVFPDRLCFSFAHILITSKVLLVYVLVSLKSGKSIAVTMTDGMHSSVSITQSIDGKSKKTTADLKTSLYLLRLNHCKKKA